MYKVLFTLQFLNVTKYLITRQDNSTTSIVIDNLNNFLKLGRKIIMNVKAI